jgi:GNAT superfamily N-acetyltransferase
MSDGFQKAEDDTKLRNATPSRTDRDRELAGNSSPSAGQKRKASSIGRSLSPIPEGGSKKPSFGTGLPVPSAASTGPAAPSLMQPRPLDSAPPAITRPRSPLSSPSKKKVKFPQRFGSGSPRRLKRAKGQNVVRIHAALKEEDLDNPGQGTEPLYVHHFFPNDETWLPHGFYTPKCQIFYHPPTMQIFIKVIKGPDDTGDVEELMSILSGHAKICEDVIGVNCLPEKDFRELLRSNEPPALLDAALVTDTWKISSQGAPDLISEVKMARFDQASKDNNEKLKGIWHRIEYLMHWFIQCQGHIWDKGDHNWRLYFAFDNHGIVSAVTSVYEFHAMPKMRHRVGNFLVLPHCQRKGVGTYLLETVYQQALDDPEVMELTVEDPSEGFCVLRDVMYLFTGVRRGLWTTDQLYDF